MRKHIVDAQCVLIWPTDHYKDKQRTQNKTAPLLLGKPGLSWRGGKVRWEACPILAAAASRGPKWLGWSHIWGRAPSHMCQGRGEALPSEQMEKDFLDLVRPHYLGTWGIRVLFLLWWFLRT